MSETKPGMPSPALTEDDVRRIVSEAYIEFSIQLRDYPWEIDAKVLAGMAFSTAMYIKRPATSTDQEKPEDGWLKDQLSEVRKALDKWDKPRLNAARKEVNSGGSKRAARESLNQTSDGLQATSTDQEPIGPGSGYDDY